MNRKLLRTLAIPLSAVVGIGALSACSTTGTGGDESGPVQLTFVNWDNGMDKVVDAWNSANPDIQVKLIKPSGTGYTLYNKLITDNKAGTNPDIAEIEYPAIPLMISNQVIVPIDDYVDQLDNYTANVLDRVQFEGKTYGVPQNICPLVFFYRKDIFDSLGLQPPKTWAEFEQAAKKVHDSDKSTYIMNFDANSPEWFAGLSEQAGGNWWSASGDTWSVNIDDQATQKVASYWQDLLDKDLVAPGPSWSPEWNTSMNTGKIVGWISGQWAPNQLPSIAPDTAGKWAAAPVPAWTDGDQKIGTWGGEVEGVTSNSKHPKEAAEFVNWMNNSEEGLNLLIKNVQVFPASSKYQSLPALDTPPPFMSTQPDYNKLMAQLAGNVTGFDIWGPNANITFNTYSDAFGKAVQNKTSFLDALKTVQDTTVSDMEKSGYTVKK